VVAAGSDYNLLVITQVKEETHTFTMLAMPTSDLRTIGQVGSIVCIGLPFDTLIAPQR
jgi:RND superfamily putative drug exporter